MAVHGFLMQYLRSLWLLLLILYQILKEHKLQRYNQPKRGNQLESFGLVVCKSHIHSLY